MKNLLMKSAIVSFVVFLFGCTMNTTIVRGDGNTTDTKIEKETGVSTQASDLVNGLMP